MKVDHPLNEVGENWIRAITPNFGTYRLLDLRKREEKDSLRFSFLFKIKFSSCHKIEIYSFSFLIREGPTLLRINAMDVHQQNKNRGNAKKFWSRHLMRRNPHLERQHIQIKMEVIFQILTYSNIPLLFQPYIVRCTSSCMNVLVLLTWFKNITEKRNKTFKGAKD